VLVDVPLDHLVGHAPPDLPAGVPGDGVRVKGVEVPAGGEDLGPAPRGASRRARFDVLALEGVHYAGYLVAHPHQVGVDAAAYERDGGIDVPGMVALCEPQALILAESGFIERLYEGFRPGLHVLQDLPLEEPGAPIDLGWVVLDVQDVVSQGFGYGAAQGGDLPVVHPHHAVDVLLEPLALGDVAEDVKPVLDEVLLDVDDVVVDPVYGAVQLLVRAVGGQAGVVEHLHPAQDLPDLPEDEGLVLRLHLGPGGHVVLQDALQLQDVVVAP